MHPRGQEFDTAAPNADVLPLPLPSRFPQSPVPEHSTAPKTAMAEPPLRTAHPDVAVCDPICQLVSKPASSHLHAPHANLELKSWTFNDIS